MKCPVCGWGYLAKDAINHDICPSCGTEFGFDDFAVSHSELRRLWLDEGAPWFNTDNGPPPGWNAVRQVLEGLGEIGLVSDKPVQESAFERNAKFQIGFTYVRNA